MIFVVSSKDPKPDLLMLDKQLAFAESLNLHAIIVLNKTDLDKHEYFKNIKEVYEKIGYTVIETEAKSGAITERFTNSLAKGINALAGNSGVGKSTLINAIFGKDTTLEGKVSKRNKRGKNTTTATKLYELSKGIYIADTPGFSTFDIADIESKDLYKYFIEFIEPSNNCEFIGCTHIKEESCGIKQAVNDGKIDKGRYERFCKIYQELKDREERRW